LAKKKSVEKKPREMTRRQLSHHKKQVRRQRIIFIGGISVIVVIVLIVLLGWFLGEYVPMHRTVIKVGDVKFNTRYFIDTMKIYGANQPAEQLSQIGSTVVNYIIQNEVIRQDAGKVGITVSDEDVEEQMGGAIDGMSDAYMDLLRAQIVQQRVKDEHIDSIVPVSDNQVNINSMLVESDELAMELRDRLLSGDNFTALDREFAQNYTSKHNDGAYGWHPASILKDQLGSDIPIDFAFNSEPGTLSPPLSDNESYKQLGYWLIRVQDISEDEEAAVQALFLSSQVEAVDIKSRLEAGDNLTALADEYTQYSPSKEGHGDLGLIAKPDDPEDTAITETFDAYVFGEDVKMGEWSNPVSDNVLWTRGGAWLVEVIDKEADREISTEDRTTLINQAYDEWVSTGWQGMSDTVDQSALTEEVYKWATERALKELEQIKR
jgi:parvulin-like peptidyl-prolyl isomerase